eukprot:CAMPEP_0197646908 /NCGR_PEP_ID=MMETSP1338-20131121/23924_1 /TAXON_ID=43686 ORGANISM="Pelagodinium beii, Strain RCC1491" /NCGR_SAMPLE_ID=MMETSP1338 /ASSEMBLY_ACC=CAM_ASM_000754 /LENGTH=190 /DNA_ID=CAMNT_0043220591 /DNA_START=90 /DNA_END=662 /DNA_ORIENTATION=-
MTSLPKGSSITDITKEASRKWKETSDEDKAPFQQKYEAAKQAFTAAMAEYKAANPEAQETPKKKSRTEEPTSSSKRGRVETQHFGPQALAKQAKSRRRIHGRAERLGMRPQLLMLSQDPEIISRKTVTEAKILQVLESKAGIAALARSELLRSRSEKVAAAPEEETVAGEKEADEERDQKPQAARPPMLD